MTTRKPNSWNMHCKKFAHSHNISYRDAMKNSECRSIYHASKVTAETKDHTVSFHTAKNPPPVKVEKPTKRLTKKRMEQDLQEMENSLASLKKKLQEICFFDATVPKFEITISIQTITEQET